MPTEKSLKNLKPPQSSEEARERGRKGGIASGKARREKKSLREGMKMLMELEISDKRSANKLKQLGVDPSDFNNKILMLVGLMKEAQLGNVAAFDRIRDLLDEEADNDTGELPRLIRGFRDE